MSPIAKQNAGMFMQTVQTIFIGLCTAMLVNMWAKFDKVVDLAQKHEIEISGLSTKVNEHEAYDLAEFKQLHERLRDVELEAAKNGKYRIGTNDDVIRSN